MKNPIEQLESHVKEYPNRCFLKQPIDGVTKEYSFSDVYDRSKAMASALNAAGLESKNVALLSQNCAHWVISDFAIWMSGAVSVPLLTDYSLESLKKIFEMSEVKVIFCGKLANWK